MPTTSNDSEIRALVEGWARAVREQDMDAILAGHTDGIVMFDVPLPPQSVGLAAYRKTWDLFFRFNGGGPGSFDVEELHVTAGEAVAFCYGFVRIFDSSVRLTMGVVKDGGRWLIQHEHHSYPAELDAT